jgi:hypothetical protein
MRKPGNKGSQGNYYMEGSNAIRLFSAINNTGVLQSGIATGKYLFNKAFS